MAKKTPKKIDKTEEPEISFSAQPPVQDEVLTQAPESIKKEVSPAKSILKHYRFITTISNVNIGNVIFDNRDVVVFECDAHSQKEAVNIYKKAIITRFNGDENLANTFVASVFGSADNIVVEEYEKTAITRSVITL